MASLSSVSQFLLDSLHSCSQRAAWDETSILILSQLLQTLKIATTGVGCDSVRYGLEGFADHAQSHADHRCPQRVEC